MKVDYVKFAEAGGFKDAHSASTVFSILRKKLTQGISTKSDDSSTPTPTKGKRKAAAKHSKDDANNFDEDPTNDSEIADNEQTPGAGSPLAKKSKAPRKPKAKSTRVKTEEDDAEPFVFIAAANEDIAEDTPVKPKRKYTRKLKDSKASPAAKRAKKEAAETEAENGKGGGDNNTSIFGGDKAVKAEQEEVDEDEDGGGEGANDDFTTQTASQEQLAAENALVPDAA